MSERIKQLTNIQEAIIVIIIGLGLFIYSSIRMLIAITSGPAKQWTYTLSENGAVRILAIEIGSLIIISYILNKRGWRLSDLNLTLSIQVVVHAFLILVVSIIVTGLIMRTFIYAGFGDY